MGFQCSSRRRQNVPQDISQYVDPKPLSRRPIFLMTCRGELGLPYKTNAGMSGREGVKRGWGSMSSLRLNIFKDDACRHDFLSQRARHW